MCAYYWSYVNNLYRNQLEKIPPSSWVEIDYTSPDPGDIWPVINFLGLKGITQNTIESMLNKKINSLRDRFKLENQYPNWKNWDSTTRRNYDQIASSTMQRLGYYSNPTSNWKPENYGKTWETFKGEEWYQNIYKIRQKIHEHLLQWIHLHKSINSIADFGCGLGVGYNEFLKDKIYVGVDLSSSNIEWCKENRVNPHHTYFHSDFITDPPKTSFDLVFSSGTIDNTYDIDQFLKAMVQTSHKFIYLTAYRGYFPHLVEHRYRWNEEDGCFYNDLSSRQVKETLETLGCSNIEIQPLETGNPEIPHETLITAEVPQ